MGYLKQYVKFVRQTFQDCHGTPRSINKLKNLTFPIVLRDYIFYAIHMPRTSPIAK